MSEWIQNILRPLIKEAVEETAKEYDEQFYRGVIYGETKERLKIDQEHEQELFYIFDHVRQHTDIAQSFYHIPKGQKDDSKHICLSWNRT